MAYIGAEPVPGQNREIDDISSGFNGSATAFTLQVSSTNVSPESANNILVNLGGVMQNPGTDYTIAASTITFTTAPASGLSFWALILGAGINTATVADDTIGSSKLIDTAVTAGSYTTADITVDAQGRITAAASGTISGAEIADQAVTNAKVNNSAAIAGTKISPDFGSQNIVTTGSISGAAGTLTGDLTIPDTIVHTGDTNTKIRFPAADTVSVETAGSERLRVDLAGRVLIGHSTARTDVAGMGDPLIQHEGLNSDNSAVSFIRNTNSAYGGSLILGKTRGTSVGANTLVQNGDDIFTIRFAAGDGTDINSECATIKAEIDGVASANDVPGRLAFATTADGASSPTERMRIDSSGNVGIGVTSIAAPFHVKHATTNAVAHFESGDANVSIKFLDNSTSTAPAIGATGDNLTMSTGGIERVNVNGSTGRIGIGQAATACPLHVFHSTSNEMIRAKSGDEYVHMAFEDSTTTNVPYMGAQGNNLRFITGGSEHLRIEDDNEGTGFGGATLVTFDNMKDHSGTGSEGARIKNDGGMVIGTSNNTALFCNRRSTDGTLINFLQNGSSEGSIAVSGSAVSYNGGHLSRWSQLKGISSTDKSARPTIYQGTVMSNLDDLCSWSHAEVLYDADVLYTLEDTLPEGKSVGDVKHAKGSVLRAAYTEENQQLNMTKISDVDGDKDVAGIFWAWDDEDDEYVNDFFVAMTGDMVIRVAASTTVARGDLLISAGDGTAKPQADDIIRSSTIAKIISTNFTATYADGSKAYPCVLMAC